MRFTAEQWNLLGDMVQELDNLAEEGARGRCSEGGSGCDKSEDRDSGLDSEG
jgi:hypothetical protein